MSDTAAAAMPTAVEATNSRRDTTSDTRRSGMGACLVLRAGAAAVNLLRPRCDDTVQTVNPQDPDALIARLVARYPGAAVLKYVRPSGARRRARHRRV